MIIQTALGYAVKICLTMHFVLFCFTEKSFDNDGQRDDLETNDDNEREMMALAVIAR